MATAAASGSMADLFRNRFIQAILISNLFLHIGIWVRNYSILLYVMDQTNGDSVAVSLISVAEFAPIFIFSFIGGAFADRWRPKRTMIGCELLSAASSFAVLFALIYGGWQAIFFATLVSAILSQFSQPSGMKLFKLHVPGPLIQMGMSLYQTTAALFMILGPVLGTFVYQQYGINTAIAIMGIMFLLSAAALTFLPADRKQEEGRRETTIWQELGQGFRYVLKSKVLTTLGGNFLVAGLALGLIQPLGIFLVTERLGLPKENLQWLMAANGVAMLIGGALAVAFAKRIPPQRLLMMGMAASVVGIATAGLSTHLWLTLAAQFVSGLFLPCIHIGISTTILQNTEEGFVGRVNGILNPLFMGAMVVTMSCAGVLKKMFSIVVMYESAALLFIVGILILLPIYNLRGPSNENAQQQATQTQSTQTQPTQTQPL